MDKNRSSGLSAAKPLTRDQLVTLADLQELKEDLLLAIKTLITQQSIPQHKKWLKSYEVRKLLGVSHGTLQTLRNNGTIPYTKIGGIIYYDEEDVAKMINKQKRNRHMD